ncbi:hypothetical protein FRC07_013354 [Ceratobasidium sp. 392]|nr:hypothetical protein FRC07_013354 [Ceratobasidium sp. 392]
MGASISTANGQIGETQDAQGNKVGAGAKELMDVLWAEATERLSIFNGYPYDHNDCLIPMAKILSTFEYSECCATSHDAIVEEVRNAAKDFSAGPIADGIVNLAQTVFAWLSSESFGSQLETQYAISVDPVEGICRLDALFLVTNFSSNFLRNIIGFNCNVCVVKSSIQGGDTMDNNTLRILVDRCFETSDIELREAVYQEILNSRFGTKRSAPIESL